MHQPALAGFGGAAHTQRMSGPQLSGIVESQTEPSARRHAWPCPPTLVQVRPASHVPHSSVAPPRTWDPHVAGTSLQVAGRQLPPASQTPDGQSSSNEHGPQVKSRGSNKTRPFRQ
jgi:hypothetical protein